MVLPVCAVGICDLLRRESLLHRVEAALEHRDRHGVVEHRVAEREPTLSAERGERGGGGRAWEGGEWGRRGRGGWCIQTPPPRALEQVEEAKRRRGRSRVDARHGFARRKKKVNLLYGTFLAKGLFKVHLLMVPKAYETLTLRQCTGLIQPLMKLADAGFFLEPVDPEKLRIPDYFDVVKSPMDLSTVNRKLELGQYRSVDDFIFDVRLVWRNAYLYNKEGHVVHTAARRCELEFEEKLAALISSDAATRGSSASAGSNASEPAPERICTVLKQILRALVGKPEATHFRKPFDWNAAGCLNYPQIVSKPMDLGSASRNLDMVRLFF